MAMIEQVFVPDVGEAEDVEVVELLVALGDQIALDASIVVLESDKASMEIPSPCAGIVTKIVVGEGDKVTEGSLLVEIEIEASNDPATAPVSEKAAVDPPEKTDPASSEPDRATPDIPKPDVAKPDIAKPDIAEQRIETSRIVSVPDVGDVQGVVVVEILVQRGEKIENGQSVVVLESDKASMEIPADLAGVVQEIFVHEGDEVKEGDPLVTVVGIKDASQDAQLASLSKTEHDAKTTVTNATPLMEASNLTPETKSNGIHAGPAVRRQAREYGVQLSMVSASGRKGRILKEDIQDYVKERLGAGGPMTGAGIPEIPEIDFSKWGEVEQQPLSRIRKASARNLHRSWLNVPHVTQFDEADITSLEAFRAAQNQHLQSEGVKITPLAFLIRAAVDALIRFPHFNSSISRDYEHLILKKYYNIGIAVETDDGLVVPVLKNADKKGVVQLAQESAALAALARAKKLPMDAMQGATFTISSLGGIGGTAFTPIVNAPEVAILGVSRSKVSPVFDGETFVPRTMLPLCLSYDHRAIDGAQAARFTSHLAKVLSDLRLVLM
jgi:pyruvate dehydrogenase E2 component (dihydrolipoamide acetyltransferase)